MTNTAIDDLCINTIRTLAIDAVQQAGSGHPGTPMGAAPMAYTLWTRFLRHNPANPDWPDRDRFVLSPGHASVLLYSLLHLTGYDLPLDELKALRRFGSRTPGHPERGHTPGVELTTGPLGAGFAAGVGLAIAERFLAAHFNTPDYPVVDHYTYGIVSDGDLMEGVAAEAASLAGDLGLGKLIYLYDDNGISIEGSTDLAFSEQVDARFRAYGWHVEHVDDSNDVDAIARAIERARAETERPSLIMVPTTIGFGSPNLAGSAGAHGSVLGDEEVRLTKEALGWPASPAFHIPADALAEFRKALDGGRGLDQEWSARLAQYRQAHPELARTFETALGGDLPGGWDAGVPSFTADDGPMATRVASGKVLNGLIDGIPTLVGGSADLAPSTNTYLVGHGDLGLDEWCSHNMHFGVREHAMGNIVNGMALHGGVIPYAATFFVFSDYMRPALRLAAIQRAHAVFIFTHDSVGVGEDGPTHQPIEHLASLRAMPGMTVYRPADANETVACWRLALQRAEPCALVLSRQALPVLDPAAPAAGVPFGAYVLADAEGARPDVILIATGSEVSLAFEARQLLAERGLGARVVSFPSWELFAEQPEAYRDQVLPPEVSARVAVEAGSPQGWRDYVGPDGASSPLITSVPREPLPSSSGSSASPPRLSRTGPRLSSGSFKLMSDATHVAVGVDHAGFLLKEMVFTTLEELDLVPIDVGTFDTSPVDYPDIAVAVASRLVNGEAARGILVCGSGVGASIAANKVPGVYAALCHDTYSAHQGVEHDDMNVLCLGARVVGSALAAELVSSFVRATYSGAERHERRVQKVRALEHHHEQETPHA